MAKKTDFEALGREIIAEMSADLDLSFNEFIRFIANEVPEQSPQYTGFFASSWKASLSRPVPEDQVKDFEPWHTINVEKRRRFPEFPATISPRFDVPKFKFGQTVFIGNTTKYARYALGSPKSNLIPFVGGLEDVAGTIFGRTKSGIRISGEGSPRGSKYTKL